MTLHFVGFRGDEYNRAQKIFGIPDFIHHVWDSRAVSMTEEIGGTIIFANNQTETYVCPFTRDDSRYF